MLFQVPTSQAESVVADMRSAGYDAELLPDQTLRVWIFAGQSELQAELLVKRLAPEARLVSGRPSL